MSFEKDEKLKMRRALSAQRQALSADRVRALSGKIVGRLIRDPALDEATRIALYADFRNEVATRELAAWVLSRAKRLYLPRVARNGEMDFAEIADWRQLMPGTFGVLEPSASLPSVLATDLDLIIVPGVAFDEEGGRLGLGRGYYDRVLKGGGAKTIGLAYDFQIVPRVPREPWDRSVDRVFTESRVLG